MPKDMRDCRGAILIFSAFAFAIVISMLALATEVFRMSAASSQQYDGATLAAETAMAAAFRCWHGGTTPTPTLAICRDYARAAAVNALNNSRLAGQTRVGSIAVDIYTCAMHRQPNGGGNRINIGNKTPEQAVIMLAETQSMVCAKLTTQTTLPNHNQIRAAQVAISGAQLPTFFKLFPASRVTFNRGLSQVMYAPDNSPLGNPNLLLPNGHSLPAVHGLRKVKPGVDVETGQWMISVG